jgi:hypothetical protein
MRDHSPVEEGQIPHVPPAILADNASPQRASSSMQDLAHRLLAALQAEGYGNNVIIAGNNIDVGIIHNELSRLSISSIQARQESESSVMLGLEFDGEEWTSSFWNGGQSPINHHIGSQSAGPTNRNSTTAAGAASSSHCLQVLFSKIRPASFLNESWAHQQEVVGTLEQFSMPTIALNDVAITDKALNVTQPSVTLIGSDLSWSTEANKGVTYPSHLDDIMAGISP